jgi:polar amino acid transport system substrate-binding protein
MLQKKALRMSNSLKISAVGTILFLLVPFQAVCAQTVLEKISKTGVLTAGTSKDAFPLAYADGKGQLVGYSVDMLQLIKTQVEKELKRPITLKLVALSPGERIPKLQAGEVDIVCDSSSFTWERDKLIDFSVSYGITGTALVHCRKPLTKTLFGEHSLKLKSYCSRIGLKAIRLYRKAKLTDLPEMVCC